MAELTTDQGHTLLLIARSAIEEALLDSLPVTVGDAPFLLEKGASFVTLERHGQLRGCIGSLTRRRALGEDVHENALMAAFHDRRFDPLRSEELEGLEVKVSVLSEPRPLDCRSEEELLEALVPDVDGVVLEAGARRATFLPQVWQQLPAPEAFLARLRVKAGLPAGFWSPDLRFQVYSVQTWSEKEG